jgi:polysaccharide biosynthesis protein PslH
MKILLIVPYTPTLIRVRPYQLLRTLAGLGHQVTLATLWTDAEEQKALAELAELGIEIVAEPLSRWQSVRNSLGALPTATPIQADYCWQPRLAHRLSQLVQRQPFDVIHVEHLRGVRYGLYLQSVLRQHGLRIPMVWDSVDCISHLFRQAATESRSLKGRLMTRLELVRTQAYEGALAGQFDGITITSPVDKAALEALAQRCGVQPAPIHVLPTGVDLGYFAPAAGERSAASVLFSGKMSYHANITAALFLVREVMPRVWVQRPEVQVWLAGKDPTPPVRALARGDGAGKVTVTGTVADLRPYLQKSTLAVAPMPYGAGIQNKVIEAMACGTPVIASPQASSALQAQPGRDLLQATDAAEFAAAILHLLGDPSHRQRLAQSAQRYVETHHRWEGITHRLAAIYADAAVRANRHASLRSIN